MNRRLFFASLAGLFVPKPAASRASSRRCISNDELTRYVNARVSAIRSIQTVRGDMISEGRIGLISHIDAHNRYARTALHS